MKKLRPIGKIENGKFIVDQKKHDDFFKKHNYLRDRFHNWFEQQIHLLTEKHKSGYFLVYLRATNNHGVKLTTSFDVERYRDENGTIVLPISDLW